MDKTSTQAVMYKALNLNLTVAKFRSAILSVRVASGLFTTSDSGARLKTLTSYPNLTKFE